MKVRHMDEIAALRAADRPDIGVITTPGWAAQGVADLLVRVGVTSLLNFAPRVLTVPPTVHLRYVDLSIELQVLGFYRARQEELEPRRRRGQRSGAPSSARSGSPGVRTWTDGRPRTGRPAATGRLGERDRHNCEPDPGGNRVSVVVVGLQHTQAPLPLLEATAVADGDLHKMLGALRHCRNVQETVVLSTCLRTEVYAVVDRFHDAVAEIYDVLSEHSGRSDGGAVRPRDHPLRRRRHRPTSSR